MTRPHVALSLSARRSLANQAMQAAIATRARAQRDQHSPLCVYGLCESLGVTVRFNDINMEGMYQRGTPPRIHLSARRPLPRRAFNCAHELGHHIFGHGSSIDELREDADRAPWEDPKELLADTFASFVLMPTLGIRRAFASRGWAPETATPVQLFTVACDFGVGYATLVTHLAVGIGALPRARFQALRRATPKTLRAEILGENSADPLIVADLHRASTTLDAEVGTQILLPSNVAVVSEALAYERTLAVGNLFRAVRSGIVQLRSADGSWAVFVRISPKEYTGLAQYRHLEDDPDE